MQNEQFWEDYGFIERGKLRKEILKNLNKPKTPRQVSKELKIHLAEASRVLIELTKRGLATCLTPNLLSGRVYGLTDRGKKVMNESSKN